MRRPFITIGLALLLAAIPASALALSVELEFETAQIDRAAGEVVISGTYTCDLGTTGEITAVIEQGMQLAGNSVPLVCTGTEQTWEVRAELGTPPVHPGPSGLSFGFTATDGVDSIASGRFVEIFILPR